MGAGSGRSHAAGQIEHDYGTRGKFLEAAKDWGSWSSGKGGCNHVYGSGLKILRERGNRMGKFCSFVGSEREMVAKEKEKERIGCTSVRQGKNRRGRDPE